MKILKSVLASAIDRTVKQRVAGSHWAYALARRIVSAYENRDVVMERNGERWLVRRLAQRGPLTALDVGANQGEWAEAVLSAAPNARLLCFEPVPATFAALERAINGPNVTLVNMALSSEPGTMTIHAVADNPYIASVNAGNLFQPELERVAIELQAITGDQLLKEKSLERVNIVKIDAEGHDFDVLKGFANAIHNGTVDMFQFEYNVMTLEAGRSLHDFFDYLSPQFLICRLLPNGLEACGYHPTMDNFGQSNWVAIRKTAIDRDLVQLLSIRRARGVAGFALSKQLEGEPGLASMV